VTTSAPTHSTTIIPTYRQSFTYIEQESLLFHFEGRVTIGDYRQIQQQAQNQEGDLRVVVDEGVLELDRLAGRG
jgi:hypothetical protein